MKKIKTLLVLCLVFTVLLGTVPTYAGEAAMASRYNGEQNRSAWSNAFSMMKKATQTVNKNLLVASVGELSDVSINQGTSLTTKLLPKKVTVKLANGLSYNVKINWTSAIAAVDTSVSGTYELSGTISLSKNWTNPNNYSATLNLTIVPDVIVEPEGEYVVNRDPNPNTSLVTSAGTTIYEFDSSAEYKESTSATIVLDKENYASGKASVLLTPNEPIEVIGTDMKYFTIETEGNLGNSMLDMENLQLNLYVEEKGNIDYMLARFYTDDTNYSFFETAIGEWELVTGWNKVARLKSEFTYTNYADSTLTATWDNITRMEFFVVYEEGKTPTLNFDEVVKNVQGNAKILFTFDDAWKDIYQIAYPILETKGFKATTWANMNSVVDPWDDQTMSWDELNTIYKDGWDIGNHTVNHPDDISTLSDTELRDEYLVNQEWLISSGWARGAKHVCYPSGQYSEKLISILKGIGVESARTTVHGITPVSVSNIYKIKTVAVGRDTDIDKYVKNEIDRAVATGSTIMFMFHRVEETPEADDGIDNYGRIAVSTAVFEDLVDYVDDYVQDKNAEVVTISEWYSQYMSK
jgi:peptidoglycan/xylan/chitin deacetylase (PgdA/CDA1 family)